MGAVTQVETKPPSTEDYVPESPFAPPDGGVAEGAPTLDPTLEALYADFVPPLEGEARVGELTQMLGAPSETGRLSIEEMLREVAAAKSAAA